MLKIGLMGVQMRNHIIAILVSAACYFWGTGFNEIWPLAWIAPLPILWLGLSETRSGLILISAFLAYFLGSSNEYYYLQTHLPISLLIPSQILGSIFFAIIIFLSCQMIKRRRAWYCIFVFPTAWVTYEFVNAFFSSAGTLDSLAYSQTSILPIIQIASITGLWGISFLLSLFPSTIIVAWYLGSDRKNSSFSLFHFILSFIIPLSIFSLVLIFGFIRLASIPNHNTRPIGLLTVPETISDIFSKDPERAKKIAESFIKELPKLKIENASLVLMPEKILTTTPKDEKAILALFQKAADNNQLALVLGINQLKLEGKYNTALWIEKNGNFMSEYHKQHMLPGLESGYILGKKTEAIPLKFGLAALAICKDMDFIFPSQQYAREGVGLMLVPALDFVIDDWLHAKPAIMRGVEGGYAVVRVAQRGLLTVSDAYGRVLARQRASPKSPTFLVSEVPIGSGKTIYSQYGDWFAWLCSLLFLILVIRCKSLSNSSLLV